MTSIRDEVLNENSAAQIKQLVWRIENDFAVNGKNKMSKADQRNIMLIGRTRTGKSTIKSLLINPSRVPDELTLRSGTRDPLFESFFLEERKLVLNIIDTPGLFERGSQKNEIRDNETIMNTIQMCVNMEITKFHVIAFCMSLTSGINSEDIQSLETMIKSLGNDLTNNACLIITHCESKTETQRKKLKDELTQDAFFQKIASFFKLGIFFSGSINRDDVNQGSDNIKRQYVNVCDYRDKLIDLFCAEIKWFPVYQLLMNQMMPFQAKIRQDAVRMTEQRCAEYQRLVDELQRSQIRDRTQIKELLAKYEMAVAAEERAKKRAQDYDDKYKGYQHILNKDVSNTQRRPLDYGYRD